MAPRYLLGLRAVCKYGSPLLCVVMCNGKPLAVLYDSCHLQMSTSPKSMIIAECAANHILPDVDKSMNM